MMLMQVWAVRTPRQAENARRVALQTWLQRNEVITVSQTLKLFTMLLACRAFLGVYRRAVRTGVIMLYDAQIIS